MTLTRIALALLALASAGAVRAQAVPDIGRVLNQTQPAEVPRPRPAPPPDVGGIPPEPRLQALPGQQDSVEAVSIEIVGNRVIDTPTLMALVAGDIGKRLTLAELEGLALRLTRYYRAQGYFVARAYVPAQEVKDGRIVLRVIEGNYGEFRLDNHSRVRSSVVQGMLDEVKGRDIVSLDTIERAMLLINDTPGVRVTRADVSPGKQVGTSDFAVATEPTPAYGGFVMLDNYGSRYTGRERLSFNVDANSPTGRGDRLSASGLATAHGDLLHGRLAYSSLLMPNGLRGDVAVSRTRYELGDAYRSLDAQGTAEGVDAQLSYPLRRIRAQTILLSLGASYKSLEDEIRSTGTTNPKRLLSATGGVSIRDESDFFGKAGITQGSVVLSVGNLRLRDASAAALDAAGAQTAGRFGKLVLDASRANLLPAGFMLTASLRHQHALSNKNLDSSERMSVSGSSAVSAYPIGELLGTNATLARLELSRPLAQGHGFSSEWQVFADWGQAAAARPLGPTDERRSLSDVGAGLNLRYEGALLKAVLARRTSGAPVSEAYPKYKLLVQAGWVF